MKELKNLNDVKDIKIDPERPLFSASHDEIIAGMTTDIYFIKTMEILRHMNISQKEVVANISTQTWGNVRYRRGYKYFKKQKCRSLCGAGR